MCNFIARSFVFALSVFFFAAGFAYADDASNAQNQAAMAQANLLQAQLNNQKAELDLIHSALQGIDPSKYKTSAPSSPQVNATVYKQLSEEFMSWLQSDDSPVAEIAALKKPLIIERASLPQAISVSKSVYAQLRKLTDDLNTKRKELERAPPPVVAKFAAPAIGAIVSLGNLVTSYVAAAKPQYAFGTTSVSKADELFQAAFYSSLLNKGRGSLLLVDPDEAIDFCYPIFGAETGACAGTGELVKASEKMQKAITDSRDLLNKIKLPIPPKNPNMADPSADLRQKYAALAAATDSADKVFKDLFVADANGTVPFLLAEKGEFIDSLLSQGAYLISLKCITMDADTVVRDSTFSPYRLSIAGTAIFSWRLSDGKGVIRMAGFKVLSSGWIRQKLQ